ncbi:NADP-dependent oxidoreductase [Microbacterium pseudoresistens]|uniref:Enoyl reductase n=1 Tax=Microbacterium pseudoresistens TaxID=640634 RepID=A0A7Y9EUM2_9MICO|nr:NADP-dependent oxidoreductase [Microbacterium pseudoresistens]NYD54255.1 enoyl reductase [Microbacterium pseudoresistens]
MSRSIVVARFGGPDALELTDGEEPHAGPSQVRVRVTAAGLNPVDLRIAEGGATAQRFGVAPPFINGNDFAGVIDEVGSAVTEWSVGDRVYGGARCRAQVDHLIIDDVSTLNPTPESLDDVRAAVLDIAGRTALAGIRALRLGDADTVLVTAAAGGCGVIACQLARQTGAAVVGTASAHNHEFLRSLGVAAVEYGPGVEDRIRSVAPGGITAVFDGQGRASIVLALALGVPPSRINSIADRQAAEQVGALSVGRATTPTSEVRHVAQAVAAGALRVHIDGTYPLDEVRDAYHRLDSGHVRGKLALVLTDTASGGQHELRSRWLA